MAKNKVTFHIETKVQTLAIKCYDEQLIYDWNYTKRKIRALNKSKHQGVGIRHDKDTYAEEFWAPAAEKPHYHIYIRGLIYGKTRNRFAIGTMLRRLGIEFREEDALLWENGGIDTCGRKRKDCDQNKGFTGCVLYGTHETPDCAVVGKHVYDRKEMVSNLTPEELDPIREGYVHPSEANRKVSNAEFMTLDGIAEEKGYNLESFEDWVQSLDFVTRNSAKMKTVEKTYWHHAQRRIEESSNMLRLCVYIQGEPNYGKTYNSTKALQKLGYRVFTVDSKDNSGKFDRLKPEHSAMVVDDATVENLLSIADNKICAVYRRNKNNPFWTGEVLVVTSNKDFDVWARECGVDDFDNLKAARDRFYICHIEEKYGRPSLICEEPSKRGSQADQKARFEIYTKFRDLLNEGMAEYTKLKKEEMLENIYCGLNTNRTEKLLQEFLDRKISSDCEAIKERIAQYKTKTCPAIKLFYIGTLEGEALRKRAITLYDMSFMVLYQVALKDVVDLSERREKAWQMFLERYPEFAEFEQDCKNYVKNIYPLPSEPAYVYESEEVDFN